MPRRPYRPRLVQMVLACTLLAIGDDARSQGEGRPGKKFALLVGVRQYKTPALRPLKYPDRDMEGLLEVLLASGYEAEDVRVLTQERAAKEPRSWPDADNIREELDFLLTELRLRDNPADSLVVALAGHGVMDPRTERSYFCAADVKSEVLSSSDPGMIDLVTLYESLKDVKAGFKLLLVDACRNDPLSDARNARPVVDLQSVTRPLKRREPGGVAALFSCSEGQRAYEDDELGRGVFFHYVIEGLKGEADRAGDGDGRVMLPELAHYASVNVFKYVSRTKKDKQVPDLLFQTAAVTLANVGDGATGPSLPLPLDSDKRVRRPTLPSSETGRSRPESSRPGEERSDNALKMAFCWCPPTGLEGFWMGSPPIEPGRSKNEGPVKVRLSQGFWMGKCEVTQAQWQRVMGTSLRQQRDKADPVLSLLRGEGADHPIYFVSHAEADEFCRRLTESERAAGRLPVGWEYRLPTEAQWEYACRAGTTTPTAFGIRLSSREANFYGRFPYNNAEEGPYRERTTPVGHHRANAWGLHDMHGNVREWCADGYESELSDGADPEGPSTAAHRVCRGGSWDSIGENCRSAFRSGIDPSFRGNNLGFRVARVPSGE